MDYIQLNSSNTLKLGIKDNEGNDTGEILEFDLEDIELPLRYQEMIEEDKKNRQYLANQIKIIDKKQDHKGKKLLSANEEAKVKALNEFYRKETKVYEMFLGDGAIKKILNGRKLNLSIFDECDDIIEKQIMPVYKPYAENLEKNIKNRITEKYSKKEGEVISET